MAKQKGSKTKVKSSKFQFNKEIFISLVVIVLLTLIVYSPSFKAEFLNWDDDLMVIENETIKNLNIESLQVIFTSTNIGSYNPLVVLTYALEYKYFRLDPKPYHITNVVIHVINSLLVFWMIYLLCRNNLVSLFSALLFSVHPLHVEAVAWVTSRKEVLYSLFYLSSIVAYIFYARKGNGIKYYVISIVLYIFSVLSKPVAVTLPLVLIIIDYYFSGRFEIRKLKDKIPFFIISLTFTIAAFFTFEQKSGLGTEFSALDNIFIFFYSLFFYLYKLIFPFYLSPIYSYPLKENGWMPLIYLLSPAIILGLVIYLVMAKKFSPNLIFASLFFIVTILPVSNIVPIKYTSLVFDRFTYIPYIGFFFVSCSWIYEYYQKGAKHISVRNVIRAAAIVIIVILSYFSYQRAKVWGNSIALWEDAIEKFPVISRAYCFRAEAYYKINDIQKSINDYTTAIRMDSTKDNYFNDRGIVFREQKEFDYAYSDFNKAIQLNPNSFIAHNNLGILLSYEKKYDAALIEFDKAIEIKPDYVHAYINKGNLYNEKSNFDSALIFLNKALEVQPYYSNIYYIRGTTYMKLKDYHSAINDFQKNISLNPDFELAYRQLTVAYFLDKDYDKAWDNIYIMKNKRFPLDKQFMDNLQKVSGRSY